MAVPVLHVCDKFGVKGSSIHGVSRLFSWWFPRYDATRYSVSLCGLKAPEPASELLRSQGIPVHHLGRGRFDPRILGDLLSHVRRTGARLLHVHGYASADFGRVAARIAGIPLVLHEHFADPRMPSYQGLADRLLAGLTHRAIAVSESTRDFLVRERHVPADLVDVVWNGAPLDEFAPAGRDAAQQVRSELGLPLDAPIVGVVGRLSLQKGHVHLLDALPAVIAAVPDVRLLVVGDGDQGDALGAQARALGIADRVTFAGHRADVPAVLAAIDVLAIPSLYEGTPLALFEAMASAKTIVSTAVDGCSEVLRDGTTALLVPPGQPGALADALVRVLRDEPLGQRLARAARAASADYDIAECVRRMEAIYDALLKRRSVPQSGAA